MIFMDDNQSKAKKEIKTILSNRYGPHYLHGVKPVQLEYDSEGVPFPPQGVEYDPWVWNRFVRKLQRRARKFESTGSKVTYQRLIEEKLVLVPPPTRKVSNRQGGQIAGWVIKKTIEDLKERGIFPFTSRIAAELGICAKTLRKVAKQRGVDLPNRKWRAPRARVAKNENGGGTYMHDHVPPLPIYVVRNSFCR
jgi:hypothetical protein